MMMHGWILVRWKVKQDVHFAHARGFIAKTSAMDKERLQEMLIQSYQA